MSALKFFSPTPPIKIKERLEIGLHLNSLKFNPRIHHQQFFRDNGILGQQWEILSSPPEDMWHSNYHGLVFKAKNRQITLAQKIVDVSDSLEILPIALACIRQLPQMEYQGVVVHFQRFLSLPAKLGSAREYIAGTILTPASSLGKVHTPKASVTLTYELEECPLQLTINEAIWQQTGEPSLDTLLFSGKFIHKTTNINVMEQRLKQWRHYLNIFEDLVSGKFLG